MNEISEIRKEINKKFSKINEKNNSSKKRTKNYKNSIIGPGKN